MDISRRRFIGAALATTAGFSLASCVSTRPELGSAAPVPAPQPPAPPTPPAAAQFATLLDEATAALSTHADRITYRDRIGLVDFGLPSSEPRFHVIDMASGRLERSYLVAHGSGSDPNRTGMLQLFSNVPGSNASSRGAYLTGAAYLGEHGRSRRLIGLDADNSMALDRAIVIHGAAYVDPRLAATQGRIGRSQGCLAVAPGDVASVMGLLGEGRMIYAGKLA